MVADSLKECLSLANACEATTLCIPAIWCGHNHSEIELKQVLRKAIHELTVFSRIRVGRKIQEVVVISPNDPTAMQVTIEFAKFRENLNHLSQIYFSSK